MSFEKQTAIPHLTYTTSVHQQNHHIQKQAFACELTESQKKGCWLTKWEDFLIRHLPRPSPEASDQKRKKICTYIYIYRKFINMYNNSWTNMNKQQMLHFSSSFALAGFAASQRLLLTISSTRPAIIHAQPCRYHPSELSVRFSFATGTL